MSSRAQRCGCARGPGPADLLRTEPVVCSTLPRAPTLAERTEHTPSGNGGGGRGRAAGGAGGREGPEVFARVCPSPNWPLVAVKCVQLLDVGHTSIKSFLKSLVGLQR